LEGAFASAQALSVNDMIRPFALFQAISVYTETCSIGISPRRLPTLRNTGCHSKRRQRSGDSNALDWEDVAHSHHEPRFKRLGLSVNRRVLLVVYTIRREHENETIRIISARQASRRERQAYTRLTD
jgi:uncharacterized DUF497 family protein